MRALSLCAAIGAQLTALAVEGKLPAYAATAGDVDEVKREKDQFFAEVLEGARERARSRGIDIKTDLVPGHAAEVITHYARAHGHDLIVVGHAATSWATTCSAPPLTAWLTTPIAL